MRRRRSAKPAAVIAALIAVMITTWMQRGNDAPPAPRTTANPTANPTANAPVTRPAPPPAAPPKQQRERSPYHLERVPAGEREQLRETLALIDAGGPFPYPKKDGTTFGNRENRLPQQERGFYREYTVPTPGAKNRGARRVIRGRGGETYYTNDHYATFVRLDE